MIVSNQQSALRRLGRWSQLAASLCAAVCTMVIVGWQFDRRSLTTMPGDSSFVAPNTAVAFILCSLAILLLSREKWAPWNSVVSKLLAGAVALFAVSTAVEYFANVSFGIDAVVYGSKIRNWGVTPYDGRFAFQTSIAFTCAGLAILFRDVRWRNWVPSEVFSAGVALVAFTGILGYWYGAKPLYGVMALETALIFCSLSVALLLMRPQHGFMRLLTSESGEGVAARHLLLATFIILPTLGWLQLRITTWFSIERGTAIAVTAGMSVFLMSLVVLSAVHTIRTIESRRRESDERFRSLSVSSPVGIFLTDKQGKCLYMNPRCAYIGGFKVEQGLGEGWLCFIHPEDQERIALSWREAIRQEREWYGEFRWGKDETGIRWSIARGAPMRSELGAVIGYAGTLEDVTERKLSEEAIRKTDKLAAMGRLAGTIAHEINNPLEALTNLFYLLRLHPSLDATARTYADIADQQLKRIASITRQTLSFYRESTSPKPVALAEVLSDVVDVHRDTMLAQSVRFERLYETDGTVIAHPGELRQVFMNLVSNALQAMPSGGTLRVHVFSVQARSDGQRQGVRVNVVDTGAGIPPEIARRMFEPFFTTKAEKGTGLGLWVSRGIVAKHEGAISFRSMQKPKSTCFSLFLPSSVQQVRRPRLRRSSSDVASKARPA